MSKFKNKVFEYPKYAKFEIRKKKEINLLSSYRFKDHPEIRCTRKIPINKFPRRFQASPDSLLELAGNVVRKFSLPKAFEWTNFDVIKWIESLGLSEYKNTFHKNAITGHTLLYLDSTALCTMNIKNSSHINKISSEIRKLYGIEIIYYIRSISLPPRYPWTHYLLYYGNTGIKYESTNAIEFWRRMQILHHSAQYEEHWTSLEKWLKHSRREHTEMFGYTRQPNLYRTKTAPTSTKFSIKKVTKTITSCLCKCKQQQELRKSSKNSNLKKLKSFSTDDENSLIVMSHEYIMRKESEEEEKQAAAKTSKITKTLSHIGCICSEIPCRCSPDPNICDCIPPCPCFPDEFKMLKPILKKENKIIRKLEGRKSTISIIQDNIREKLLMILPTAYNFDQ